MALIYITTNATSSTSPPPPEAPAPAQHQLQPQVTATATATATMQVDATEARAQAFHLPATDVVGTSRATGEIALSLGSSPACIALRCNLMNSALRSRIRCAWQRVRAIGGFWGVGFLDVVWSLRD